MSFDISLYMHRYILYYIQYDVQDGTGKNDNKCNVISLLIAYKFIQIIFLIVFIWWTYRINN